MARSRLTRVPAVGAALSLLAAGLTAFGVANARPMDNADNGAFYDDFTYTGIDDPAFAANGWSARGEAGGPGVPGATWSPGAITFPVVDGVPVAQLSGSTDGTSAGTVQAELSQSQRRFYFGTYASRVYFTDTPVTGAAGDHVNETYFTISPLAQDYDPAYSELDFSEYLPGGGWGTQGPINYQTSWYTYRPEPWDAKRAYTTQNRSLDGWHDLVAQVADGHVKYYIDGVLTADHTTDPEGHPVTPRQPMALDYNLWLIDLAGHSGGTSTYVEQVAWTYYAQNEVVTPDDALARAAAYRDAGIHHEDTLTQWLR